MTESLFIVTIEAFISDGRAIARIAGKPVFIPYAAPGDVVEIVITKNHAQYGEGEICRILSPSPERVTPKCSVYGQCGGCQWQHMDYTSQLKWKKNIVEGQLRRIGKVERPTVCDVIKSPRQWEYRNRVTLHASNGRVGFYQTRTHQVLPFEKCWLLEPTLQQQVETIQQQPLPPGQGDISLSSTGVPHFVQVNSEQNARLIREVLGGITNRPHQMVVELYSGEGNFTFPIASLCERLIAVESSRSAVLAAQKRAKRESIHHIEWRCALSKVVMRELAKSKIKVDGILLDPPRTGAKDVMEDICKVNPKWIAYVSCDPATLARDIRLLRENEYILEFVQPLDMFPQTYHIECIAWLSHP